MAEKPIEITMQEGEKEYALRPATICHLVGCSNCPFRVQCQDDDPEMYYGDELSAYIMKRGLILTIKGTEAKDDHE